MPETNEQFRIVIEGPISTSGEMDVRDLAPALLALGDIFNASNEELNGEKAKSSVRVRATEAGSFVVDLNVWVGFTDAILSLLDFAKDHHEGIVAAKDLVDLIGWFSGGLVGGGGLLALLKWLKGRKPDKIKKKKGGKVIIVMGDAQFVTNQKVIQLAESLPVREGIEEFSKVLEKEGVERVRFEHDKAEKPLELTPKDAPSLKIPDAEEETILDTNQEMALQIISPFFKPDRKWRFSDGENTFTATIKDEKFLAEVANSERAFAQGDTLVCIVHIRQYKTPAGVLKTEREIIEVKKHIQAARQLKLL